MPKGDPKRIQNAIDTKGGMAQGFLNDNTRPRVEDQWNNMWNTYQVDRDRQAGDYNNLMGGYGSLVDSIAPRFNFDPTFRGALDSSIAGYGDFAKTGGFSDQDISTMRARAEAPTRAIYANANTDIDRQRALQGGYSPNYTAAKTKLARNLSQSIGDADINSEAALAQMRQQGRLAGLGGMASTGATGQGLMTDAARAALSGQLAGMGGMANLYGATPGRQALSQQGLQKSTDQILQLQDLTQQLANLFIQGQLGRGQMPTRWDAFKSFGQGVQGLGSGIGGAAAMSSAELKEDFRELTTDEIFDRFDRLKLYTWKYKGDSSNTRHIGPTAEDMQAIFGVGDGKTIALIDVMGITMMLNKAIAKSERIKG